MDNFVPLVLLTSITLSACGGDPGNSSMPETGSSGGGTVDVPGGTGGTTLSGTGGEPSSPGGGTGGDAGTALPFPAHDRIATNNGIYCALSGDRAVCWGSTPGGVTDIPELSGLVALHNGYYPQALGADGTVYEFDFIQEPIAWINLGDGVARLADDFRFLRSDGAVISPLQLVPLPPGTDSVIDAARAGLNDCFIRASDRAIVCSEPTDECTVPSSAFAPPSGRFQAIEAGGAHLCAIAEDGTVSCWGAGTVGPDGAVQPDGFCPLPGSTIKQGQDQAPAGTFTQLSAGAIHTCAVRTDGTVACWGAGTTADDCQDPMMACGQSLPPADSDFVQVAAGYTNTCGLKSSGKVVCWGADTGGRSTPPLELQP